MSKAIAVFPDIEGNTVIVPIEKIAMISSSQGLDAYIVSVDGATDVSIDNVEFTELLELMENFYERKYNPLHGLKLNNPIPPIRWTRHSDGVIRQNITNQSDFDMRRAINSDSYWRQQYMQEIPDVPEESTDD